MLDFAEEFLGETPGSTRYVTAAEWDQKCLQKGVVRPLITNFRYEAVMVITAGTMHNRPMSSSMTKKRKILMT